jgi:hypothetical protein
MAKKSSKKQPIRPITAASHTDTSRPVDTGTATTITSLTPPDDTSPLTRVAFREFIELADLGAIKTFITTAASSSEGENLKLLWGRAFKEGLMAGHTLYGKTEERLKEVHDCAYETGYNEGRRDEQEDWLMDGHGYCVQQQSQHPSPGEDSGTQTDLSTTTTTSGTQTSAGAVQSDCSCG